MDDDRALKAPENHAAPAVRRTPSPSMPETVLVVEDERSLRELIVEVLRQQRYVVLQAPNGKAALKLSLAHPGSINLIVTDLVMPLMNGAELVREAERQRPGIKVLYISGHWESALERLGIPMSGSAFLAKPFALGKLVSRVRDILNTPMDARRKTHGQEAREEGLKPNVDVPPNAPGSWGRRCDP